MERDCHRAGLIAGPFTLSAQTNCDEGNGPLNTARPSIDPQEIIQKFAAREAVFKEARNHYTYTQEIVVQTLDGDTVDGEFRQIQDITYDDKGARVETVKYAPMDTLKRIMMTKEDFDDFRTRLPFVLTTEDLPKYDIIYVGQQKVDELDTFVFEWHPSIMTKMAGHDSFRAGSGWTIAIFRS